MAATENPSERAREAAMNWAMRTAEFGEDPVVILARAQLYEDYLCGSASGPVRGVGDRT